MKQDPVREERIIMEIVVDAYGAEEQAMGWYYYLADNIQFPFTGMCVTKRGTSPIKESDQVTVIGMASEEECEREMFVKIEWEADVLEIPLSQIEAFDASDMTQQAVDDWHYWVDQGYSFD